MTTTGGIFAESPVAVLGLDPGPELSGWCALDPDGQVLGSGTESNAAIRERISGWRGRVAVEMIASYGIPVGREVFQTVLELGRFVQVAADHGTEAELVYRQEVKLELCQSMRANDSTIRQALPDCYGPGRDLAIGRKLAPGPLYKLKGHAWAALAVAVTAARRTAAETRPASDDSRATTQAPGGTPIALVGEVSGSDE